MYGVTAMPRTWIYEWCNYTFKKYPMRNARDCPVAGSPTQCRKTRSDCKVTKRADRIVTVRDITMKVGQGTA